MAINKVLKITLLWNITTSDTENMNTKVYNNYFV